MPTSPRDLEGGTGWYQPTALFSNLRADEGHRPLREGRDFSFNRARPDVLGVPSTPAAAAAPSESTEGWRFPAGEGEARRERSLTFPWGKVDRRSRDGRGAVPGQTLYRPTPVRASPCHPPPGEGFFYSAPIRSRDSFRFPSSSTAIRSRTRSTSAFMSLASHSIRVPTMACL